MTDPTPPPADILVVDDTPANLKLLTRLLQDSGLRARPVLNGVQALAAAAARPPDLVLLDVDMPEMDGYEVCRRIKSDPRLAELPVLFLSALGETEDKIAGFAAGGVDYITKPFRFEEVLARISTHLELRRLRLDLEQRNRELDESYLKLRELEGLRHDLVHMLAHDMRSPLMAVSGYLELLQIDRSRLVGEHAEYVDLALDGARALIRLIDTMLDLDRLESRHLPLKLAPHDLSELLRRAVESLGPASRERVESKAEDGPPKCVSCDAELIERVFGNLVSNALRYSPEGEAVRVVQVPARAGLARVEVRDRGPGIPEEIRARIFEKYVTSGGGRAQRRSIGLGLAFCKLAIEAHGGAIGFHCPEDCGTTFWVELPICATDSRGELAADTSS